MDHLLAKFNGGKAKVESSFEKTTIVLDKISESQYKLCTLMESLDRRINGKK